MPIALAAEYGSRIAGTYTVVTNRSREVTCASAPTSTHGSGQWVKGSQRRCPSRVYGYGVCSVSRFTTWSGTPRPSYPSSSAARAMSTISLVSTNAGLT